MKLAFVLFHYFPYGGLERDMLAIAQSCAERGHDVTVYTQNWDGDIPDNISLHEIRVSGLTNHSKASTFTKKFQLIIEQQHVDVVVGFNKMPGLDIYYAADTCFAQKAFSERNWFYRLTARCRQYLALERAVFCKSSTTKIWFISPLQIPAFKQYYQITEDRFCLLPPGIRRDRMMPDDYEEQRILLRQQYAMPEDVCVLLMVGSDFRRKGVDRAIKALTYLVKKWPRPVQLWIVGQDDSTPILHLASKLGVADAVKILGPRKDIPQLMWAADVFVHPAYSEAAGAVLLEAVAAGLPVVATNVCGYAHFIEKAEMGKVITGEQAENELADVIEELLTVDSVVWKQRARLFMSKEDIFSMSDKAVDFIESYLGPVR